MRVVFLCGEGTANDFVYTFILENYDLVGVIVDEPQSKYKLVKRRIKKLGYIKVFSQLLFMTLVVPFLKMESSKRCRDIIDKHKLQKAQNFPSIYCPGSINNPLVIEKLNELEPELVIVHGTRIIAKKILKEISIPILNIHSGITPQYRGVHGGYWALVNKDHSNFGVTVHRVDSGIDTGAILEQGNVTINVKDNFCSYPLLQITKGVEILDLAIKTLDIERKDKETSSSKLYYHPGILEYLFYRFRYGVK
tara:strand:+ start:2206 stop:2958 length:753 start_codon:yes stop_codon:yes gene_type:complete